MIPLNAGPTIAQIVDAARCTAPPKSIIRAPLHWYESLAPRGRAQNMRGRTWEKEERREIVKTCPLGSRLQLQAREQVILYEVLGGPTYGTLFGVAQPQAPTSSMITKYLVLW